MPGSVTGNTRASRSRVPSPQTAAGGSAGAPKQNGTSGQRSLKDWLEPLVQQKPSYQEAGLVRQGVVENMAPLGTLPSKKAVPRENTPSRTKIVFKSRHAAGQPTPARAVTPEATPEQDGNRGVDNEERAAEEAPALLPRRRSLASREVDDEYEPKAGPSRARGTRRSLGMSTPRRQESVSSLQADTPATNGTSRHDINKEETDDVVNAAVQEALSHYRYPTAYALKTLWEDHSDDADFLAMVNDVFYQTASAETTVKFSRLLRQKKKEGKKDNKGLLFFVERSTSSQPSPHKPTPAPYGDLIVPKVPDLAVDNHVVDDANVQSPTPKAAAHKASTGKRHKHRSPFVRVASANDAGTANSTPSRRRRKGSMDSSSDLSSARSVSPPLLPEDDAEEQQADAEDEQDAGPEPEPKQEAPRPQEPEQQPEQDEQQDRDQAEGRRRTSRAAGARRAERSHAAARAQPIAMRRRSAAKKHADVSPTPNPPSPTHNPSLDAAAPGMLAAAQDALLPNLTAPRKTQKAKEPSPQPATYNFPSRVGVVDENDRKSRLRRDARKVTDAVDAAAESFARGASVGQDDADQDSDDLPPPPPPESVQRQQRQVRPATGRSTRSSLKRTHDEIDDEPSPVAAIFPPPEAPGSALTSRAGTPGPRAKRQRTGPRVKNSPVKKKDGPSAGVPRASGERGSPGVNGAGNNQDENDDYCSSCSGSGELVCCDGCTRSFHFKCVDPPFQEEGRLPDEWYCNVCVSRRHPSELAMHQGAFGSLMTGLDKQNSRAFRLPGPVRDRFEGVKTGADGEFEDGNAVAPPKKKKNAAEEGPDYHRLRDNNDAAVLCHDCGKQTQPDRAIITCAACGQHWHLDCVDPPLARPPVLRTWKCPAHVDDLQSKVPGPAHKWRDIKDAPEIRQAFSRGLVNNGFIDVDMDGDASEDESGWNEPVSFGRTYVLPAKGIKSDFMSRFLGIKEKKKAAARARLACATTDTPHSGPTSSYLRDRRLLDAAQAAQNVAAVATLAGPAKDRTGELIEALVCEADANVVALMARANPLALERGGSLSNDNKLALEAMKARITHLLETTAVSETKEAPALATAETDDVERPGSNKAALSFLLGAPAQEDYLSEKSASPANARQSSSPTKPSDDEDTEIDDAPIATPVTTLNENSDGPDVTVAAADVLPGETEVEPLPKTAPVTITSGPTDDGIQTQDIMPTPSTSPVGTQNDADEVKTPAPPALSPAIIKDEKSSLEVDEWPMELDD